MEEYRRNVLKERDKLKEELERNESNEPQAKRCKTGDIITLDVNYNRKLYPKTVSPIQIVYNYCKENKIDFPVFSTTEDSDRTFKSIMEVAQISYTTKFRERRKKSAEQAAAMVFLRYHNMHDGCVKT